ncbi:MAG: sel1 repeat family protein [Betaproteobacteria bacterium]|nr:sel1 repeat family protein [Betaproteobacteria bacterium]
MADRDLLPLIRNARAGNAGAQFALGKIYLSGGHGVSRNPATAFHWLQKAAAQGIEDAERLIGDAVPSSAVADPVLAAPIYERAASAGSRNAQKVMSHWLLSDAGVGSDEGRGLRLLARAAEKGDRAAQLRLACLYQAGDGVEASPEQAYYWFEQAAIQGSLAAQQALAERDWSRSDPAAMKWLSRAAKRNDVQACYRYGVMLLSMNRVQEAVPWLGRAAEQNHAESQLAFGLLHAARDGARVPGVAHSYKRAVHWLERAARLGLAQASYELSKLYSLRNFSLRDPATADRYLEQAAERGHAHAQYLAGLAYLRRRLEPDADLVAVTWLERAARLGHSEAAALLRRTCPESPAVPHGLAATRAEAIRHIGQSDLAIAVRLELACAFGLRVRQALTVDPLAADRANCLLVDLRGACRGARRRIVLIGNAQRREVLDRAKRVLQFHEQEPGAAAEKYRRCHRAMIAVCAKLGIDPALFEPPESTDRPGFAPAKTHRARAR